MVLGEDAGIRKPIGGFGGYTVGVMNIMIICSTTYLSRDETFFCGFKSQHVSNRRHFRQRPQKVAYNIHIFHLVDFVFSQLQGDDA